MTKTVPKTPSPAPVVAIAVVAIVGPTGAGKSALALHVARHFPGEIVNCDSVQLFRGFDIGTAKLPASERQQVPHHLIDVLQPEDGYSAGDYARDAKTAIAAISARAALPVIAGGTGFYLRALLIGLPNLPGRDHQLRANLAARETKRPGALHRLLTRLDPTAALRIHSRDLQKLTRALEIRVLTRAVSPPPAAEPSLPGYRVLKIGLNPDRAQLYQVLDARAREMFHSGRLLEEIQGLLAQGATGEEKPFESLGYKQALQHLRGLITLEQAIESTQLETRQYAKRQWTWFRREPDIIWLDDFGNAPAVIEEALELVRQFV